MNGFIVPDALSSPPVVSRHDRQGLLDAARAENLPIDLRGARFHDGGWENLVLATVDGWILRFPRDDRVPFDREMAWLRTLRHRLTVPIPEVVWTGRKVRMAAYRQLTGAAFSAEEYARASPEARNGLARSLALFLVEMHGSLSLDESADLGITPVRYEWMTEYVTANLARVPDELQPAAAALTRRYTATWVTSAVQGPLVVLHNDYHPGNVVLTAPVGELAGVWDFSCVQVGVPTYDLRYFEGGPRDLLLRFADEYHGATGNAIDIEAAVAAYRMEKVCDALELGRPELLPPVLQETGVTQ